MSQTIIVIDDFSSDPPPPDWAAIGLDPQTLDELLDQVKFAVFTNKGSAFFGPLMCGMTLQWAMVGTAMTNGQNIWWDPVWFMSLPAETRPTILVHELKHVAYLHMVRYEGNDFKRWNYACDYVINNELDDDGWSFKGAGGLINHDYDGMSAEQIYDLLPPDACAPWGAGGSNGNPLPGTDMQPATTIQVQQAAINNVVMAVQSAKAAGCGDEIPVSIQRLLDKFLEPKVSWQALLQDFLTAGMIKNRTMSRPNRRYRNIYLPSKLRDRDKLPKVMIYDDVSCSMMDPRIHNQLVSEIKYVKDVFKPHMTIVQFASKIISERVWDENTEFTQMTIDGTGGTSLQPVRAHMLKHKPDLVIILSDLVCTPMQPGPTMPVLWVVTDNPNAKVAFGKKVHIKTLV